MLFIFYSFPFGRNNFCLSGSHLLTHLPAPICRGVNFSFPILCFSISGLLTHSSLKSLFLCCSFLLIHYEHFSLKLFRIFFFYICFQFLVLMLTSWSYTCWFLFIIFLGTLGRIVLFLHTCLVMFLLCPRHCDWCVERVSSLLSFHEERWYLLQQSVNLAELKLKLFPRQRAAAEIFHYFCQTSCSHLPFTRTPGISGVSPGFCRVYTQFVGSPFYGFILSGIHHHILFAFAALNSLIWLLQPVRRLFCFSFSQPRLHRP